MSEGAGLDAGAAAPFRFRRFVPFFDRTLITLLFLLGPIALSLLLLLPHRFLAAEDATILFQYSRNLATHGSISFQANGPRVEGATDFAWMVLVAAGMKVGLAPSWTTSTLNLFSILITAWMLIKLANQQITIRRLLIVVGAMALVPQIFSAISGFAVLEDAALLTALVLCTLQGRIFAAPLLALALCLFRPDGVLFALPLLAAVIVRSPYRLRAAGYITGLFILPGLLYFIWRWHYFGEFFPLPFIVKSNTPRASGLFVRGSIHDSLAYLEFTTILLAPLFASTVIVRRVRHLWLTLPLLICPTLFYWAMRLDQNVGGRFFYYLPLFAAIFIAANWPNLSREKMILLRTGFLAWLIVLAGPLLREVRTFRDMQFEGTKAISEALSRLQPNGVIVTSEAGVLPFFSGWNTYDAWGLNTPAFAHKFIQPSAIQTLSPDLIVFHPDWNDSCLADPGWPSYPTRTWQHMTRNLLSGAAQGHYELWLTSYGSEFYRQRKHWRYGEGDRECWLLRTDSPRHDAIAQILQEQHGIEPEQSSELERLHVGLRK